jgi:hypothetical protein
MPESRRRKQGKGSPSPLQSSHSAQTATEGKLCYKIWRLLVVSLRVSLGWLRGKISTILTWASVLIGIAAGALFFLPRVTVEPPGQYDPSSPSSIIFTIANINIVALRNVDVAIGVCYVSGDKYSETRGSECNGPAKSKLIYDPWHLAWLDVDEKYQVPLEEILTRDQKQQIEDANITIGVIYTPWRMPQFWRVTKEFRFVTKKLRDGKIYWIPTPLNR